MSETYLRKKFLTEKKSITMEDCMTFIEQYYPDDKKWFRDLCLVPVEKKDKQGNPITNEKGEPVKDVRPFLTIKADFYERYFPNVGEMAKRERLFEAWGDLK